MIECASHLCGRCADFHSQTLPLIIDKYVETGKVKLILRLISSPLEFREAVLCAQEQDAFWKFNEYLFEHSKEIDSADDLKVIAGNLGLTQSSFNQRFDSRRYKVRTNRWLEQAQEDGAISTPTFFINGQKIVGNQPFSEFERGIEEELK